MVSCGFAAAVKARRSGVVTILMKLRTFIRGLPAAHNERDQRTAASGESLPETSRVVLQSSGCPKCFAPECPEVSGGI